MSASDGDGSAPNNLVFYVLDQGRGSDKFRVNSSTGLVSVGIGADLDRDTDEHFSLRVLALDRGDPPRSATATLSVHLLDVNDERPVFRQARKEWQVYENATVGQEVWLMEATDQDTDSDLLYTWVLGDSLATTDRDVPVDIDRVSVSARAMWDFGVSVPRSAARAAVIGRAVVFSIYPVRVFYPSVRLSLG